MASNVEISKRLVLINSASSVVAKLLNVGVLVWLQQYLLRRVDADEYALLPVIMGVIVFLPLLTVVLTAGQARYVVEAYAKGDQRGVTQVISTMFPMLIGAALLLLAVGLPFAWYVDQVLTVEAQWLWDARLMMGLLVLLAAIRLPLGLFGVGLYVRQRFVLANGISLGREVLRITILFVLLFSVSTRVLWIVVATVGANLCEMIVLMIISRRLIPAIRFKRSEVRWETAKELTSFGGWQLIVQLANTIRTSADPLILNKLATGVDVTSFYLGSLPMGQIQQGSGIVSAPLQPALTAMHTTGSAQGLRSAYLRGGRYALWASLLIVVPLVVFRQELLDLYLAEKAAEFADTTTVLILLLAIFPVAYGNIMLPKIAHAKAELRPLAIRVIATQLLNVALTLYFVGVRDMGAVGSALATFLVITFVYPVLNWPLGWRLAGVTGRTWFGVTLLPGMVPALVAAFVWVGLLWVLHPQTWFAVGACAAGGGLCYVIVLLSFCMQPIDRQDLGVVLAKLRSWLLPARRA